MRAAADLRLRTRGHWDRPAVAFLSVNPRNHKYALVYKVVCNVRGVQALVNVPTGQAVCCAFQLHCEQ
jgi:hypothetical protein